MQSACKDNVVSQMIGNLGEIYNYLLKVNNFNVTIKEEMAYTKLSNPEIRLQQY